MSGTVLRAAETSGNRTKDSVSIATYIQGAVEEKKHIKGQVATRALGIPKTGRRASAFLCPGAGREVQASLMTFEQRSRKRGSEAQGGLWGEPSRSTEQKCQRSGSGSLPEREMEAGAERWGEGSS